MSMAEHPDVLAGPGLLQYVETRFNLLLESIKEHRLDRERWHALETALRQTIGQLQDKFEAERDRRMAEVATEREKALKIKETADLAALGLAREIQTYKDEKANKLREQINSERGLYVSKTELTGAVEKIEAMIKPLMDYSAAGLGERRGYAGLWSVLLGALGALGIIAVLIKDLLGK
jgi:hypothetical protein